MASLELEFTILKFYEDYVVSHVKENVVLDKPQIQEMLNVCQEYYNNKPYVYISIRDNKYNVNPVIYINLDNISTCLGIGIVCRELEACKTAEFEKSFSKIPYQVFHDSETAIHWAKTLYKNKKAGL